MQLLVIFVASMGAFALRTVLREAGGVVLVKGEVKGNGSNISRHVKMQTSEPMDVPKKPVRNKFSTWSAQYTKMAEERIKIIGEQYLDNAAKDLTDRYHEEVKPFSRMYLGALFQNALAFIKTHKFEKERDYRVLVETERMILHKKRTNQTYNRTDYELLSQQTIGLFWNRHYYTTRMPWTNLPLAAELEDRVVRGATADPEDMDAYFQQSQGEADHEIVGDERLDDSEIARGASEYDNRGKDLAAVDKLERMGFDRVMAAAAYMKSGRNSESAIDLLLQDDDWRNYMERRKSELLERDDFPDAIQNPLPASPPPGIPFRLQRDAFTDAIERPLPGSPRNQIQFDSASSLPSLPKTPPGSPQKQIQFAPQKQIQFDSASSLPSLPKTPTSVRDPASPLPGFKEHEK